MALLFSHTLSEAIDWLAEKTGEAWSIRRLLEFILAHELPLDVVPPRDAQFGVYLQGHFPPERGYLPVGSFSRIGLADEIPRFRLRDQCVIDLLEHGEADLVYAHIPADDEPTGRWVIHEPMSGPPMRVTLDMCRVSRTALRLIAADCITARLPAADEGPITGPLSLSDELQRRLAVGNAPSTSADEHSTPEPATASGGSPVAEAGTADSDEIPVADWRAKARELAQVIGMEKHCIGEREITARNVCEEVAARLAKLDKGQYWGQRGARSASTIRNEALKGWKFCPPEDVA